MKRIYQVWFEEKYKGCADWVDSKENILANGDARQAIEVVRKRSLK